MNRKQTYKMIVMNREPEINPCMRGQLMYDKGAKNTPWEKG